MDLKSLILILFYLTAFSKLTTSSSLIRYTRHANMSSLPKVLIKDSAVPVAGLKILDNKVQQIVVSETSTLSDIIKTVKDANGIDAALWSGHMTPNEEFFDAAGKEFKIFAAVSAGYDHLPIQSMKSRGILVSNTPGVLAPAVAEIAILLILAAARRLEEGRRKIVNNQWETGFQWMLGQDLTGSTVGIVGFGEIGSRIAKRLIPFEVDKIIYSGHRVKPEAEEIGAKLVDLDTLLKESDFVISAVPLNQETALMFNKTSFAKMKKTAIFVNVGRGGVVQQDDLIEALKTGEIFAAGLDVMTPEPLPTDSPLLQLPNCVLLPHLGSATIKTRTGMVDLAAKNILAALDGKPLLTPVN